MKWHLWTLAVLGLMLGAALLGAMLRGGAPMWGEVSAGGGSEQGVIVLSSDNGSNNHRLYIVDTQRKVLLVYQSTVGDGALKFVQSRVYDDEAELTSKLKTGELPFKTQGYDVKDSREALKAEKKK